MRSAAVLATLGLLIMAGCPAPTPDGNGNGDGGTPPTPKSGEGPVAFVTADDTSLTVGQTTTARLWVQQSSPNAANDNGIFSVAVNVDAAPAGIVQSQVPVTILADWDKAAIPVDTGTATAAGGIDKITAGVDIIAGDRSQGTNGPVQVFSFPVRAVAAGTATLTPTNYTSGGFKGVIDYTGQTGDQSKYVSVQITVQ
jgi:hypothetical protein